MQHSEAIDMMAAEKYLLKDFTPELRDAFEEHFFGCQECALDVRLADAFVEHSRLILGTAAVQAETPRTAPAREGWFTKLWRPAFAVPVMAVLLVLVGYQNFVSLPKLKDAAAKANEPQVLASLYLTSGTLQGANDRVVTVHPDRPFLLMVDIPSDERFSAYLCELYSPAGTLEATFRVSAEAAGNTVPVQIPARQRNSGAYKLVVRGIVSGQAQTADIGSFPFELHVQQ